jgi:cytochrome c553
MLEQGRTVAEAACARCHGVDGVSDSGDVPNLAGQRAVYLYRVLHAYQNGYRIDQSMGHAGGFLNDEGLLSVAAYYANQIPRPIEPAEAEEPDTDAGLTESDPFAGIRDDLKKCTKCHNETGNSTASGMPSLTAQSPEYFQISMQSYADGERQHKMMGRLVSKLDPETIRLMGIFYAVQEPLPTPKKGDGDEAAGRALAEDCDVCHGEDGNATDPGVPSLAGQDPRYFIKAMEAYLDGERQHQGMFDAVEGLSEADILNLGAFYAARTPAGRSVRVPLTASEWVDRCARCHGLDGNSTDSRFPMLAGQNKDYLKRSLQAYSGGERGNSTMHAMSAPLTGADIESIAAYYSSRTPKSVIYIDLPCE